MFGLGGGARLPAAALANAAQFFALALLCTICNDSEPINGCDLER